MGQNIDELDFATNLSELVRGLPDPKKFWGSLEYDFAITKDPGVILNEIVEETCKLLDEWENDRH